jgi:hypothetical protein
LKAKSRYEHIAYDPLLALRALVPRNGLDHAEALVVAEVQATALLKMAEVERPPVPMPALVQLLAVVTAYDPEAGVIGYHELRDGTWHIRYGDANEVGRDATVAHQLKRILDAPFGDAQYPPVEVMATMLRKHYVAEYFALCLTLPRRWVEQAWRREPDVRRLAELFGTTPESMLFRLKTLRLMEPGYEL